MTDPVDGEITTLYHPAAVSAPLRRRHGDGLMVWTAGEPVEYGLYVVDPAGNPLAGLSPITADGAGPAGPHGFHVTEQGGGQYLVTSNPTTYAGAYIDPGDDPVGR